MLDLHAPSSPQAVRLGKRLPLKSPAKLIAARRLAVLPFVSVFVASILAVGAHTPARAAEPTPASDEFSRTVSKGWGSSNVGGAWTASNADTVAVTNGYGRFQLTPGAFAINTLHSTSVTDSTLKFVVDAPTLPKSGGGVTVSAILRAKDGYSYQARARLTATNRATMTISRYDGSTSREIVLVSDTLIVRDLADGARLNLEFAATGSSSVLLRARAWAVGATTPGWQLSYTDSSAQRLARAGAVAVGAYLSASTPALELRIDDLLASVTTPATAPTPTPAAPTPTPAAPTTASKTGSAIVGTTKYAVPSNAIFVTAKGTATGSGTQSAPYGSLAHAISKAPTGATLVLRAGKYHESVTVPQKKKLVIQSYPGEAVWLDGSSVITGWQKSGTTWQVTNWKYAFDRRVSFSAGADETSRWTDATNPYAGYPDQVWIAGVAQKQVGALSQMKAGTFFVDTAGKRLVLGSDPTGKTVEASTLQKAMTIAGEGSTVRGIGVRRYATTVSQMGAVTAEMPKVTLENVVITQNSAAGLYAWSEGHTFKNVTLSQNGLMGLGANLAHGLVLTRSVVSGNNAEGFKPAPASGGMKITSSNDVMISDNLVEGNTSNGVWFDMSSYNTTIVKNTLRNNGRYSILYEASERAVIADNTIIGARHTGLMIYNAGNIQVWNNTFNNNQRSIWFMQDERRQSNASLVSKIPWVVSAVTVKNNVISYGTGGCPILSQDTTLRWSGKHFGITMDSNLYHRLNSSSPSNFICWANGSAGTQSFKTLDSFRTHSGGDKKSLLLEGTTPLTSTHGLTATAKTRASGAASSLPSAVATQIGATTGTTELGVLTPTK